MARRLAELTSPAADDLRSSASLLKNPCSNGVILILLHYGKHSGHRLVLFLVLQGSLQAMLVVGLKVRMDCRPCIQRRDVCSRDLMGPFLRLCVPNRL